MKRQSLGIWSEDVENIQIVVNENTNTIGAIMPTGKPVVTTYKETPNIDDFIRFRDAVIEASKVFSILNITGYER